MEFFAKLVVSGLLIGVIYGLVAVGFVLIYKASGVFNFAQGAGTSLEHIQDQLPAVALCLLEFGGDAYG